MNGSKDGISSQSNGYAVTMGVTFVRWLHSVALSDADRTSPYADIYPLGPLIETAIGLDGEFDLDTLSIALRKRYNDDAVAEHLANLVRAEAAWRLHNAGISEESTVLGAPIELAAVVCTHRELNGRPCKDPAVPGATRCLKHGGAILDPDIRRSLLLTAYSRMLTASDIAVEALIDVAENSNSSLARVGAAKEILDRVGLIYDGGAHAPTEAKAVDQDELLDELVTRLSSVRDRLQLVSVPKSDDDDVIDAHIVGDDEDAD